MRSKTIDRLSELPMVVSARQNACSYYGHVKEKNILLKTWLSVAELSVKSFVFSAAPLAAIFKPQLDAIDSYVYDKLENLEYNYPVINRPFDEFAEETYSKAKMYYVKTAMKSIDALFVTNQFVKERIEETVGFIGDSIGLMKMLSEDQIVRTSVFAFNVMNACLETRLAKIFTDPFLNVSESVLNYWMPRSPPTTLERLFDMSRRVYWRVTLMPTSAPTTSATRFPFSSHGNFHPTINI